MADLKKKPKTGNDHLVDGEIRRASGLERWRSGVAGRAAGELKRSGLPKIVGAIDRGASKLESAARPKTKVGRQKDVEKDVAKKARESIGKVRQQLRAELKDGAVAEAEHQVAAMRKALGPKVKVIAPRPELVGRLATRTSFHGGTLDQWTSGLAKKTGERARQALAQASARGDDAEKMARSARGKKGLAARTERDLRSIARTAAKHAEQVAKDLVYAANRDLLDGVMYVAVLDSATTAICRSLDGQVFPHDSGPRPPQHFNCRSTTVPVLKGEPAPKVESYGQWLKKQSASVQDEALGKVRGRLFRAGKITVDGMVDQDLRPLTLDELKAKYGLSQAEISAGGAE